MKYLHAPVVVAIARGRPAGTAVEFAVRDGDTAACGNWLVCTGHGGYGTVLTRVVSRDEHLATDQRDLDMVDPDLVGAIQGDSITTPDVLRVELRDVDVLDDDILDTASQTQTLAAKDTSATNTDDGLVRSNRQALETGFVVGASGRWVVTAPVGTASLDGILAGAATAVGVWDAAVAILAGVLTEEVELLVNKDHTGSVVAQPALQFGNVTGGRRARITTTGGTTGKTKCGALDTFSSIGVGAQKSRRGKKRTEKGHFEEFSESSQRKRKTKKMKQGMTEPAVLNERKYRLKDNRNEAEWVLTTRTVTTSLYLATSWIQFVVISIWNR